VRPLRVCSRERGTRWHIQCKVRRKASPLRALRQETQRGERTQVPVRALLIRDNCSTKLHHPRGKPRPRSIPPVPTQPSFTPEKRRRTEYERLLPRADTLAAGVWRREGQRNWCARSPADGGRARERCCTPIHMCSSGCPGISPSRLQVGRCDQVVALAQSCQ
jgi:hypothetical protein